MGGLAAWIAIWWMSEAVHLAFTALLPMLMMPILGLGNPGDIASKYMDPILFLFIGGFAISFAIEKWGLHQRIAWFILSKMPPKPGGILLGMMLATFFLSNWMSNTATCLMMFAAVTSIAKALEEHTSNHEALKKFQAALFLGLAYSATIGGMATPVGTPPNMYFFKAFAKAYPANHQLDFLTWTMTALPLSLLLLFSCFFILKKRLLNQPLIFSKTSVHFKEDFDKLAKINGAQLKVALIFVLTAALWFSRKSLDIGSLHIPGWENLLPKSASVDDSFAAVLAIFLLMLIPANKEQNLIGWEEMKKIPFDVILIFGGGFALASGFESSGLSNKLAESLSFMADWNVTAMVLGITVLVTIISEFASNVASIQLVTPILISLQDKLHLDPTTLLVPSTLAASLGFALPVATAANTIVFGTGKISTKQMMSVGLLLDIAGILLITLFTQTLGVWLLN